MKKKGLLISMIIMMVFLLLAAIGIGGFFIYRSLNSYEHYLKLGEKYLLDEDYEEAIAAFQKAIDIDPKEKEAYRELADIYIAIEDYEEALEILEKGYKKTKSKALERQIDNLLPLMQEEAVMPESTTQATDAANTATTNEVQPATVEIPVAEPYSAATEKSTTEVEEYANKVKQLFLQHKWSNIAEMICYPITIDGITYHGIPDVLRGGFDSSYTNAFMEAMEAEDCKDMFCDASGIYLASGNVIIADVEYNGSQGLRITAINGLTDASATSSTETVVHQTQEQQAQQPQIQQPQVQVSQGDYVIDWKDANLEAAMREKTGIYDRDIMYSDVRNITKLELYWKDITDVSALGSFTNLTTLGLWGNNISDVSALGQLTKLTHLELNENNLTDLSPLATLTNLTILELTGNNITDINALGQLTNLTRLYLDGNQITDVNPLANLTNLNVLCLPSNNIIDVSALANLTTLEHLELDGNNIADISPVSFVPDLFY